MRRGRMSAEIGLVGKKKLFAAGMMSVNDKTEDKKMSVLEWVILVGFGVPIVVLCCAFVVLAGMLQMAEGEREFASGHQ